MMLRAIGAPAAIGNGYSWTIVCVDCPHSFSRGRMTDRALQIDALGQPHVAYGGGQLYHAVRSDTGHGGAGPGPCGWRWSASPTETQQQASCHAGINQEDSIMTRKRSIVGARQGILWLCLGMGAILLLLADATARQAESQSAIEGGWRWGYVDPGSQVGSNRAIALDSSDYPHISAYDSGEGNLKYAYQDAAGWHVEVVDSAGDVGQFASLDLDGAGFPHISYYADADGDLKVAHRDATGWHVELVDSAGDVGQYSSLGLDGAGHAHIGYYDADNADLKYAYQDGSGWQVEVVDSSGNVGRYVSLDVDSRGIPQLAYHDRTNQFVKLARRDGAGWLIEMVDVAGDGPGPLLSLAINPQDEGLVAYSNWDTGAVYLAHRTAAGWRFETVPLGRAASLSMALNRAGEPRLYRTHGNSGSYAYRDESGWHVVTTPFGSDADFASLAVDNQDRPHLASIDENPVDFSRALVYATTPNYLNSGYWLTQRSGTPNNTFRFVDADHGWATSSQLPSVIYRTGDGGATWDQIRLGHYWDRFYVTSMAFLDEQEGWATGRREYWDLLPTGMFIAHTTDGGQTWTQQIGSGQGRRGHGVWFVDSRNGWVDSSPYLWRTHDGGETWTCLTPTNMPQRVLRFVNPSTGYGLYQDEYIPPPAPTVLMRSDDGGSTWLAVGPVPEWQQSIWIAGDGLTLWAVGDEGRIARSSDGGATWSSVASPTTERLASVEFVDAQRGWAAGSGGVLLRTVDGGQSWQLVEAGTDADITHLALADWDEVWIHADRLRRTRDAGVHWSPLPSTPGNQLQSVRMGSTTTGWAGGSGSRLLKTNRSGSTWFEQVETGYGLVTLEAVDNQHAWILYGSSLQRTVDGGQTWQLVDLGLYDARDIDFVDPDRGWLVSYTQVLATTDGGMTWTPQTAPSAQYLYVDFVDDRHGWIMARDGGARTWFATEDAGQTWEQVNESANTGYRLGPMDFVDQQHGWAIDSSIFNDYTPCYVTRTDDGGDHWQLAWGFGHHRSLDFVDSLEGWVVGEDGLILYTRDGGVTWSQAQHELRTSLRDVHAPAPGIAWLVGDNALIVHYSAQEPPGCWATPTPLPPYAGTPPPSGSVQRQVTHCMDDAYVRIDTETLLYDSDVVNSGAREDGQVLYSAGFLFRDVRIPQGAQINSATLRLEPWGWQSGVPIEVDIRADLGSQAVDFNPANLWLHLRPRTAAQVTWVLDTTATSTTDSPDISHVIEEAVGQADWRAGDNLAVYLDAAANSRHYISWRAWDSFPGDAARLLVTYQMPPTPVPTPTWTATPKPTATVTPTATSTLTPTATSTPTATPAMHYRYLPLILRR
jgi:photosystem II stability/assembly factor-like uncharacterized protein